MEYITAVTEIEYELTKSIPYTRASHGMYFIRILKEN